MIQNFYEKTKKLKSKKYSKFEALLDLKNLEIEQSSENRIIFTSNIKLAERWNWKQYTTVMRFLNYLEKESLIKQNKSREGNYITLHF